MKKIVKPVIVVLAVISMTLQSLYAQKKAEAPGTYNYYKAMEIIKEQGVVPEAVQILEENIKENPDHILSYLPLMGSYRDQGKYSDALNLVNMAISLNHKNSTVSDAKLLWWKACIYEDFGNIDGSIALMEQAVKKAKKSKDEQLEDFQEEMAQMYYDDGRYNEADRVYQELFRANGDNQLALVGLSRNLIAREKYQEALDLLDYCKKLDSSYHEIYRFQMQAYAGVKEYKNAIDAMLRYYELTEDSDYIYYDLLIKSQRYSIAALKQRIVSDPNNIAWKYVLSELYSQLDMDVEAIAMCNQMINEYGDVPMLLKQRAASYSALELSDLALADLETAIKNSTNESLEDIYLIRSAINVEDGKFSEALADIDLFVERYPTYAIGYYYRGIYQYLAGNYQAAVSTFSDGIEISENYSSNYLQRGRAYVQMDQKEKALADFEMTLNLETEPSGDRAFAFFYLGRTKDALDCMYSLIADNPQESGYHYNLACLYSLMNKGTEAVAALQTAFENGFKRFRHIQNDRDLDNIRDREDFKALILKYREQLEEDVQKVYDMLKSNQKPVDDNVTPVYSEIPMKKQYGGTYEVPCVVNGLPLMMIFDTGAADVTISTVEASFMFKNGYLTENDIKGSRNYVTADGGVHAGTVITLKEVKLGDAVLRNVEASVVHNQKAPLLLGQSVLEKFGTITIDNVNLKITIQQ